MNNTSATYKAKPFVKWVGGKSQLLNDIKASLPTDFEQWKNATYVEPFVGGGAVLFWILQNYPNIQKAIINDVNAELICTYRVIKEDVNNLIYTLQTLQDDYIKLNEEQRKEFFLQQRKRFNSEGKTDIETAALFIFLNRTCFNGLYRVNSKGAFNVPHGRYTIPKICDEATLRADSAILQRVDIYNGDFTQTEVFADKETLFYLDPPYRPLTETSAFTSYAKDGFSDLEQTRLCDFCNRLTSKKALFIASNSDPKNVDTNDNFFDHLYSSFHIKRVFASRMINAKGNARGTVSEIMISNIVSPL